MNKILSSLAGVALFVTAAIFFRNNEKTSEATYEKKVIANEEIESEEIPNVDKASAIKEIASVVAENTQEIDSGQTKREPIESNTKQNEGIKLSAYAIQQVERKQFVIKEISESSMYRIGVVDEDGSFVAVPDMEVVKINSNIISGYQVYQEQELLPSLEVDLPKNVDLDGVW